MEKRNLGNIGTKVGALGIGAMSFPIFMAQQIPRKPCDFKDGTRSWYRSY